MPFRKRSGQLEPIVVDRARLLRKKATEPERVLWRHLRNRRFAGYKFRRQHPFHGYVLDFYCASAKLAIEWTVADITIVQAKFAIARDHNSWLAMESLCCDSGIIRFARSSIECCERSGSHSRNNRKDPSPSSSPKPTPLPSLALARPSLPKGERRERRSLTPVPF